MAVSESFRKVAAWGFVLLAVINVTAFVALTLPRGGLTDPDWPAWVQAIGSIAAILAAFFIARSGERYRRTELMITARIVSATMLFRLVLIRNNIGRVARTLGDIRDHDGAKEDFEDCLNDLDEQVIFTSAELAQLAPMPNSCALNVAKGVDRLLAATSALRLGLKNPKLVNEREFRAITAGTLSRMLQDVERMFKSATESMSTEIQKLSTPMQ